MGAGKYERSIIEFPGKTRKEAPGPQSRPTLQYEGRPPPSLPAQPSGEARFARDGGLSRGEKSDNEATDSYQAVEKGDWLRAGGNIPRRIRVLARCLSPFSTRC
jgi:hypothetical protein